MNRITKEICVLIWKDAMDPSAGPDDYSKIEEFHCLLFQKGTFFDIQIVNVYTSTYTPDATRVECISMKKYSENKLELQVQSAGCWSIS